MNEDVHTDDLQHDTLPFIIKLSAGKINQNYNIILKTNIKCSDILTAYDLGVKIIGVDLVRGLPGKWYNESNCIPEILFQKYLEAGFNPDWFGGRSWKEWLTKKGFSLDEDCWFEIYLFTCEKGNQNFKYKYLKYDDIYVGGLHLRW